MTLELTTRIMALARCGLVAIAFAAACRSAAKLFLPPRM